MDRKGLLEAVTIPVTKQSQIPKSHSNIRSQNLSPEIPD